MIEKIGALKLLVDKVFKLFLRVAAKYCHTKYSKLNIIEKVIEIYKSYIAKNKIKVPEL